MLNKTEIAAPLGVTVPTITQWLSILKITGQILLVPPFFENFGKRLVKSPKLYFTDSGLTCHVLGIPSAGALSTSPFAGALFEGFVASELVKRRLHRGRDRQLFSFRDQQGLEVDFIISEGDRKLTLLEAKATRPPMPGDARALLRPAASIEGYRTKAFLVHADAGRGREPTALCPGVKAVGVSRLGAAF